MASNRSDTLSPASKPPGPTATPNQRPAAAPAAAPSAAPAAPAAELTASNHKQRKRKGHRGGKKKRSRRKSFAALTEYSHDEMHEAAGDGFYKMPTGNLSGTSIDSQALLDHREQKPMRIRRPSTIAASSSFHNPFVSTPGASRLRTMQATNSGDESGDNNPWDEAVPLLSEAAKCRASPTALSGYGASDTRTSRTRSRRASSRSLRTKLTSAFGPKDTYDVNHPPSVPGSPAFGAADHREMSFGDVMIRDDISLRSGSPRHSVDDAAVLSDTDMPVRDHRPDHGRRMTSDPAEDVCFSVPGMSEICEDEAHLRDPETHQCRARRRRAEWPDLSILDEWRHFEKGDRRGEVRVKKITEPQLINGRLRPVRKGWFQIDEDVPYRFTYFNEEFQSTIHSQTISELVQPGSDFRELFIPDPRILSDDEDNYDDETMSLLLRPHASSGGDESKALTRQPSVAESRRDRMVSPPRDTPSAPLGASGRATPMSIKSPDIRGGEERSMRVQK